MIITHVNAFLLIQWEDPLKFAPPAPSPTTVDLSREESAEKIDVAKREEEEEEEYVEGAEEKEQGGYTPRRKTRGANRAVSPKPSSAGSSAKKAKRAEKEAPVGGEEEERPALLFLDSLSMHSHTKIGKHISG